MDEELRDDVENTDGVDLRDDALDDERDDYEELLERLERAEQLLLSERNRRLFERAAERAGIRPDRVEAAAKLAGVETITDPIDDEMARKLAEKILAEYPEFSQRRNPLTTDQGVPSGSRGRAAATGDALEMLRILRRG